VPHFVFSRNRNTAKKKEKPEKRKEIPNNLSPQVEGIYLAEKKVFFFLRFSLISVIPPR
jgi:hypothetical protein